jgi:hypothetical protein
MWNVKRNVEEQPDRVANLAVRSCCHAEGAHRNHSTEIQRRLIYYTENYTESDDDAALARYVRDDATKLSSVAKQANLKISARSRTATRL